MFLRELSITSRLSDRRFSILNAVDFRIDDGGVGRGTGEGRGDEDEASDFEGVE